MLAKRLSDQAGRGDADDARFVTRAFEDILARRPTDEELARCCDYLKARRSAADAGPLQAHQAKLPAGVTAASTDPGQRARELLVGALFNHNDFITIR